MFVAKEFRRKTMETANFGNLKIGDGLPVRIFGALNISPESFYKESVRTTSKEIVELALKLIDEGADYIDLGGASSAPPKIYNTRFVSEKVELERVVMAVKAIREVTDFPISIDTQRAKVAEAGLTAGANAINDVSGFKTDSKLPKIVADHDVPVVLMAAIKKPGDAQNISEVRESLKKSIQVSKEAGVDQKKIVIDPGIGFGKPHECDLALIRELSRLKTLQKPVMAALSRKSFIGKILNLENPEERLIGSLAATSIAVFNGVNAVRTHDVKQTKETIQIAESIAKTSKIVENDTYNAIELDFLKNPDDGEEMMKVIGVSEPGIQMMKDKTVNHNIFIRNISAPAALSLKQHMLSVGGDVAMPKGVIDFETKTCTVLLIGTTKQIKSIIPKLKMNYFNLPEIAKILQDLI
ncbi:MAG: dihydropteroate synthase [Candidatus Jordarchaeum sp.]|uniref:dihydropteroate synthase n=1 Tax=Candidatus Jordarchaeum sp. TaxID=2823881 RepID=UPI00404B84AE